jgi:hypothetical protein
MTSAGFIVMPGAQAVNSTVAVCDIVVLLIVPLIVAVPTLSEDINVALYVPLLWSVTGPSDPRDVMRTTFAPPTVMFDPPESFA